MFRKLLTVSQMQDVRIKIMIPQMLHRHIFAKTSWDRSTVFIKVILNALLKILLLNRIEPANAAMQKLCTVLTAANVTFHLPKTSINTADEIPMADVSRIKGI